MVRPVSRSRKLDTRINYHSSVVAVRIAVYNFIVCVFSILLTSLRQPSHHSFVQVHLWLMGGRHGGSEKVRKRGDSLRRVVEPRTRAQRTSGLRESGESSRLSIEAAKLVVSRRRTSVVAATRG